MRSTAILDLFCGAAGGWSLGFHRAGFETVAACEIDPWRRSIFSANFPKAKMYDDVQRLTADRIVSDVGYLPKIVVGSPPCQDASVANPKGRGVNGERTGLFFEALRIVREVRPDWVCFENVPGLRTRGYDRIHDELEAAGYTCWPLVVGAVNAGASHKRQRVWIVAHSNADEIREREPQRRISEEWRWNRDGGKTHVTDSHKTRLSAGQMEPSIREKKKPIDRRPFLSTWDQWNGGVPDFDRMDDGLSQILDRERGFGRKCIAAYGDAVVPQITEVIGRAIIKIGVE